VQVIVDAVDDVDVHDSYSALIGQLLAAVCAVVAADSAAWVRAGRMTAAPTAVVRYPRNELTVDDPPAHQLRLDVSGRIDETMFIAVERRGGPAFSEADRLTLRLLRPHLDLAFRRLACPIPRLTTREVEVLLQVREGFGNAEIAKKLGVAEATVVKHLEHVFRRAGAHSRTEAVRICEPALFWSQPCDDGHRLSPPCAGPSTRPSQRGQKHSVDSLSMRPELHGNAVPEIRDTRQQRADIDQLHPGRAIFDHTDRLDQVR